MQTYAKRKVAVSKKVFERSMKKRCKKKAATDAGDASDTGIWGGVPYSRSAECRPQTSKPMSLTPANW